MWSRIDLPFKNAFCSFGVTKEIKSSSRRRMVPVNHLKTQFCRQIGRRAATSGIPGRLGMQFMIARDHASGTTPEEHMTRNIQSIWGTKTEGMR